MTLEEIREERERIYRAACARMEECPLMVQYYPAPIEWMTPEERARDHELRQMLPTFAEEAQAARKRIAARIAERRRRVTRPDHRSNPTHAGTDGQHV